MSLLRRRPHKTPPELPHAGGPAPAYPVAPGRIPLAAQEGDTITAAPAPSRDARHRELELVLGLPPGYVDARLAQQAQQRQLEIERQQQKRAAIERGARDQMERTLKAYCSRQNGEER